MRNLENTSRLSDAIELLTYFNTPSFGARFVVCAVYLCTHLQREGPTGRRRLVRLINICCSEMQASHQICQSCRRPNTNMYCMHIRPQYQSCIAPRLSRQTADSNFVLEGCNRDARSILVFNSLRPISVPFSHFCFDFAK